MRGSDLPAVVELAAAAHTAFPEDDAVLEEKWRLFPAGCHVSIIDGELGGYVLSHPWTRYSPPPLNRMLRALPRSADLYYVHDLAVADWARNRRIGQALLAAVLRTATEAGSSCISLVAVGNSAPFWSRQGFTEVERVALRSKLSSYGADARYMERCLQDFGTPPSQERAEHGSSMPDGSSGFDDSKKPCEAEGRPA